MCELGELDPCEVWTEVERKARKEHRCATCNRTIGVGEKYVAHFSIFEGDKTVECICSQCDSCRKVFGAAHGEMTCSPGSFRHFLEECVSDGDEDSELKWKPMLTAIRTRHRDPFATGV